jgi:hypothetical protein
MWCTSLKRIGPIYSSLDPPRNALHGKAAKEAIIRTRDLGKIYFSYGKQVQPLDNVILRQMREKSLYFWPLMGWERQR